MMAIPVAHVELPGVQSDLSKGGVRFVYLIVLLWQTIEESPNQNYQMKKRLRRCGLTPNLRMEVERIQLYYASRMLLRIVAEC